MSLTEDPKHIWVADQYSYIERVLTLVHEFIHILHPDWPERQVTVDDQRIAQTLELPKHMSEWQEEYLEDVEWGLGVPSTKVEFRDPPGNVPLFMQELGVRRFLLTILPFDGS